MTEEERLNLTIIFAEGNARVAVVYPTLEEAGDLAATNVGVDPEEFKTLISKLPDSVTSIEIDVLQYRERLARKRKVDPLEALVKRWQARERDVNSRMVRDENRPSFLYDSGYAQGLRTAAKDLTSLIEILKKDA